MPRAEANAFCPAGFELEGAPSGRDGPLILRLFRADQGADWVRAEAVVQRTVAELGYSAPRVLLTCTDAAVLGAPLMIMGRVPGEALLGGSTPTRSQAMRVSLPRMLLAAPRRLLAIPREWEPVGLRPSGRRDAHPLLDRTRCLRFARVGGHEGSQEGCGARRRPMRRLGSLDGLCHKPSSSAGCSRWGAVGVALL